MNVLLASTSSKYSNGASRCLVELAKGLTHNGYNVVVTLPRRGELESVLKSESIKYYIARETHYSWCVCDGETKSWIKRIISRIVNEIAAYKIRGIIKSENIDIVHMNAITAYAAAVAGNQCKVPVVWHIREFLTDDLHMHFVFNSFSKNVINAGKKAIAISNPIKEKWEKEISIPIEVINDGLPIDNYYVESLPSEEILNIVLYGRITRGKGQLFFIKGIESALPRLNRLCHFYYAGTIEDETYYDEVVAEIADGNLAKHVSYLGEINDVKSMLSSMHISCVCSQREGFGRVTVESMLGKCLVIGANTGATTEIISDRVNGMLYKENNIEDFSASLVEAINNYDYYTNMIENAQREAIQKYSLEADIQKVMKLYSEI